MRLFTRLLLFVMFMVGAYVSYAQTITIGSGTTTTTSTGSDPIDGYFQSFRYQVVYTAAELSAAGLPSGASLTGMGFSIAGDYGGGNLLGYTIKLGNTTATNSSAHDASTTTTVKNAFSYNPTVTAAGAFDMITFDASFTWNGTSNILVDICSEGSNAYISPYGQVRTIASSTTDGSRYVRADNSGSQCGVNTGSINTTKPQVSFSYTPGSGCSGTPAPGNTLTTANPVCSGVNFTLSLQNSTSGSGVTYVWESSPDGGSWTPVSGGTGASLTTSQTAATYYRCNVTCAGNTGTSTAVQVTMQTPTNCYCSAVPTSIDGNGITNVVLGTLSNPNTSTTTYQNFTSGVTVPDLQAGTSIPIAVTLGTGYSYNVRVFIDLNQDGDFTDTDENNYIGLSGSANPTTQNGTVVIPAGATLGATRMRVVATDNDTSNDPCYSGTYANVEDYTVNITAPPSCVAPTALVSSNITSSAADLSWTASVSNPANGYEWKVTTTNDPNATAVANGSTGSGVTTATASGLSSATTYYYHVRSACSGVDFSGWASSASFTTLCSEVTTFTQLFDGVTAPAFPSCWAKVGSAGTANTQASSAFSASNCLYIYSSTTSSLAVVSMQPVSNANAGTHQLKLKARANFTVGGVVEIGYLTNPLDAATFVSLSTFTTNSISVYQDVTYAPPVTVPTGVTTFAFRHTGSPTNSVLIDNVSWEPLPSCTDPSALTVSSVTMTGAQLSWTASPSNPADGYEWKVTATNDPLATAVASGTVGAGVTTASASGLTSFTTYYAHVRGDCGSDFSGWISSAAFYTDIYCRALPTSIDGNGITNVVLGTLSNPNTSTTTYQNFTSGVTVPDLQAGTSIPIAVTLATGYSYNVRVFIDLNQDGDFTDTDENNYIGLSGTTNPTTQNGTVVISAGATLGNTRMRVVATDDNISNDPCYSGTYANVEDYTVNITAPPSCVAPTALVSSNITSSAADLSWTASPSNPANGYEWKVTTTNDPNASAVANGNTAAGVTTATASGLSSATTYYYHVRSACSGVDFSAWASSSSFTTLLCDPTSQCNFTFTKTDSYGDGWNSGEMQVKQSGTVVATLTLTTGSTGDQTVAICKGVPFELVWSVCGSYPDEMGVVVKDPFGNTLYTLNSGASCTASTILYTNASPSCSPPAPANDNCAGAVNINGGGITGQPTGVPVAATTLGATASPEANTCGGNADDDVWFVFNTDSDGGSFTVTVTPSGSFNPVIELFTGPCGALISGQCAAQSNTLTFENAAASTAYYIRVYDYGTGFTGDGVEERSSGGFTIAVAGAALPVELTSFSAQALENSNVIEWSTALERNVRSHVVERSANGHNNWTVLGQLAGKGNAQTAQSYSLEDRTPYQITYYRLRTVDFDGAEELSKVVAVTRKDGHFGIVSAFPNPASEALSVQFNATTESTVTAWVTDVTGRVVMQQQVGTTKGVNILPLQVSSLSAGTYFISLITDTQSSAPVRFVKQ